MSGVHSWGRPNNEYYEEPVYDNSDNYGLTDPETGLDGPDGIPDNPGKVLFMKPMRTGYRSNYSNNFGITATISVPLDRRAINMCLKAAEKQVPYEQSLADKRLNYEMVGLPHVQKPCVKVMGLTTALQVSVLMCFNIPVKATHTPLFTHSPT